MARCEFCGGIGRVAPGGITGQLAAMCGAEVHDCRQCQGTGRTGLADPAPLPAPRTTSPRGGLITILSGQWLVEIHGCGRILAVLGFVLTDTDRRFEARSDYGGLLGWSAQGEWSCPALGNVLHFTGTQSSPYLLPTDYHWAATLDTRGRDVLDGRSISDEWTRWSRQGTPHSEADSRAASSLIRTG